MEVFAGFLLLFTEGVQGTKFWLYVLSGYWSVWI